MAFSYQKLITFILDLSYDISSAVTSISIVLIVLVGLLTCTVETSKKNETGAYPIESVRISDSRFVDQHGRQVLLNGVNLVNKNPEDSFVPAVSDSMIHTFKQWGINVIRFGINWSALEPKPGHYSQSYLDQVQEKVKKITDTGIFVFLDMHQDLYGNKFGNGAPHWATLDEELSHREGAVWSDAYMISPAVQRAFDNFWANKEVQGVGLQDHYAEAWRQVARRFSANKKVVGYDLMNEPFIGSGARQMMRELLQAMGTIIEEEQGRSLSLQEIEALWANPQRRIEMLSVLQDTTRFGRLLKPLTPIHQAFEKEQLQPFYQKVADVIRQEDQHSILFLEHGYFSNLGVPSAITRTSRENTQPDPLVAYAPHAYDPVTDTEQASQAGRARLEFIFGRIAQTAQKNHLPVLLGEWGAFYGGRDKTIIPAARQNIRLIEQHHFSQTYWSYFSALGKQSYFQEALLRPVPVTVAGQLNTYSRTKNKFYMSWVEEPEVSGPTRIFLPREFKLQEIEVEVKKTTLWHLNQTTRATWLEIESNGKGSIQSVVVQY